MRRTGVLTDEQRKADAWITLDSASVIVTPARLGRNFRVLLTTNATLEPPSEPHHGQRVLWRFTQDTTGGRTVTPNPASFVSRGGVSIKSAAGAVSIWESVYDEDAGLWDLWDRLYEAFPVGSIFTSIVSTDPATLLGYGTWSAIASGQMLMGLKSSDVRFDTPEENGGSFVGPVTGNIAWPAGVPTINEPDFTITGAKFTPDAGGSVAATTFNGTTLGVGANTVNNPAQTISWPAGTPTFNNAVATTVPPYFVVYFWKRTA